MIVCILCTVQLKREVDKKQRKNSWRKARKYWAVSQGLGGCDFHEVQRY